MQKKESNRNRTGIDFIVIDSITFYVISPYIYSKSITIKSIPVRFFSILFFAFSRTIVWIFVVYAVPVNDENSKITKLYCKLKLYGI